MDPTSGESPAGRPEGPLRVLYSFPHPLGSPGVGTTALNQVRGIMRRGHEVTVCCASVATQAAGSLPGAVHETLSIRGRRIPHRLIGVERAWRYHDRSTAKLIERSPEEWDVVHAWPLASASTLAVANSRGLVGLRESPNTYTAVAYERVARETARLGLTVPKGASHRHDAARLAYEELEYDRATAVLAPSDAVAESFAHRDAGAPPIMRHRYGFDPARFPEPEPERDPDSPFVMCFVGHCEPRKGLHHALAAWRRSELGERGARFVVVGRWEAPYRELLHAELDQPGVELFGFTDDVASLLRSADALVLPSIEEGSALVTYEAQASGCALLVSDAAGALMTDGVHGLLHRVGDVAALTSHMADLADDPETLARMRTAVIAHRDELSWDAAAETLERVYSSTLEGL